MNRFELIGRVGNDIELRHLDNGTAVANVSIATNRNVKTAAGTWEKETDWHRVTAYGKRAEVLNQYVKKGDQIYLMGNLRNRKYTDAKGI